MISNISPYLLLNGAGLIVALLMLEHALKQKVPECQDVAYVVFVLAGASGWLGAHVFDWLSGTHSFSTAGFTFYGGLMTGLACWVGVGRTFMTSAQLRRATEAAVVPLLVAHALGRIGCFLAGCCYGRPLAGTDVPHPTQLYESLFLFSLALVSTRVQRRTNISEITLYFLSYPTFRFFLEFLRGDERGNALGLSAPQWISIGLVLAMALWWFVVQGWGWRLDLDERRFRLREVASRPNH